MKNLKSNFLIAGMGAFLVLNSVGIQPVFANNVVSTSNSIVTKVATTDVHIRANAWANSPILGVLKVGQSIDVSNVINGWNQVSYNGQVGYIDYRYLTTSGSANINTNTITTTTTTTANISTSEVLFNEDMQLFLSGVSEQKEIQKAQDFYDQALNYLTYGNNSDNINNNNLQQNTNVTNVIIEEPVVDLPIKKTVITASSVRDNAILGSAVLGMILPGETIIITEIKDGYEKFDYNGQVGYIDSRHVR